MRVFPARPRIPLDRLHAHPAERDPEVPARAHPPQALPVGLPPMLASSGAPPSGEAGWAYEMKWDGMRALAYVEDGVVRLRSRNDNDVTVAFPELAALGPALGSRPVLLDGEIVVFDPAGRPSFELLQSRMHVADPHRAARLAATTLVTYIVFDMLHLD